MGHGLDMVQVAKSPAYRAFGSVDSGVQGAHAEDTRAGSLQPRMGQDVSGGWELLCFGIKT